MGASVVPAECIKRLFAKLIEDGDALQAKLLVNKFGDNECYLEQLVQVEFEYVFPTLC